MPRPPEIPDPIWRRLQEMYRLHRAANDLPARFGERFELKSIDDPYTKLRPGDRGTLLDEFTDGVNVPYTILWDSGSVLSVYPVEVRPLGQKILPEDLEA